MKKKIVLPAEVKNFFVKCGAVGGSAKSKQKTESSRKNGALPCKPGKVRGRPFGSTNKTVRSGDGLKTINE